LAKPKSKAGSRSAFRDEFYRSAEPFPKKNGTDRQKKIAGRHRRRGSLALPLFGLGFLFCIIAVAGSSAMIWIRQLGTLLGVQWSGD
jgi:hypothetical protein